MTGPAPAQGVSRPRRAIAAWGYLLIGARLGLMLAALIVCILLYYVLRIFAAHNPAPRWFLHALAAILGIQVRVRGDCRTQRTVFLANHVSWLDIPAISAVTGSAFVAHDGLASIGLLHWLCRLNDTVFIARHDRRSVASQVEQIRTALCKTGALTVFPEGTTSDGVALLPFKSSLLSALETGADHIPVQPVWLDYGRDVDDIAWVGAEPGLLHALRMLARWRSIDLAITFLPPLTQGERTDRKTMAHAARQAIATAMLSGHP